ncbi:hypothetical protein GQR58_020132 [Nymphon striatum]|nr:hypothetical protein GQR58_020132 [Nymphon striatum]
MDKTHPDYVPSIFPSASTSTPTTKSAKSELKMSRFKRRNERPTKNATLLRRSPGKELLSVDQTMSLESDSTSDCSGDAPILQNSEQTQKPLFTSERAQLYSEINSLRKERDEAQAKILTLEQAQMTGVLCRLHLWKKMKKRLGLSDIVPTRSTAPLKFLWDVVLWWVLQCPSHSFGTGVLAIWMLSRAPPTSG